MNLATDFLTSLHAIWWVALLVVCIAAAVGVLFGIAMEVMRPEPPRPPYRLEFDEFYVNDKSRKG
jgi:hypothetical protein